MSHVGRIIAVGVVAVGGLGVRAYVGEYSARTAQPQSPSARAQAHFDHTPRHGGLVLMNGDTHFEVVLDRQGDYSVYFTDAVRSPLPASMASEVGVQVTAPGRASQTVPMRMDASDARWTGRGFRIDSIETVVRISYTADGKPYWIDLPASAWPEVMTSRLR